MMEVAYHLRLPLYKLISEMPYEELLNWFEYFEKRPVGWRDDLRASYLIRCQTDKVDTTKLFPSLSTVMSASREPDPVLTLKGSSFYNKLINAKGGQQLEFL